jgi:dTMP kinase
MPSAAQQKDGRGVFITFEGGDGTGKSTQVRRLGETLAARGLRAVLTREPGGTPQAEKIRNLLLQRDSGNFDPLSEALLLFAARREHIVNVIEPALARGDWVISDRFIDSTRAFQGYGMGLDLDLIDRLYDMVSGGIQPDLTLVFDIDPEVGLARSGKQKAAATAALEATEDRYELMGLSFQERLRRGFAEIAKADPGRCVLIDAAPGADEVAERVLDVVTARFSALMPVPAERSAR